MSNIIVKRFFSLFVTVMMVFMMVSVVFASEVEVKSILDLVAPFGKVSLAQGETVSIKINVEVSGKQTSTATFYLYKDYELNNGTFVSVGSRISEVVSPRSNSDSKVAYEYNGSVLVGPGNTIGSKYDLEVIIDEIANTGDIATPLVAGKTSKYEVTVLAAASDTEAPTGNITINSNDDYTNNTAVTLNLSASDNEAVTGYRIADGADASSAVTVPVDPGVTPFNDDVPWTLPSGDGTKTVAVQYRDAAGNWSINYTDDITLDETNPTLTWGIPSPAANTNGWNNTAVSLSYTTDDNLSGIASELPASPFDFSNEGASQTIDVIVTDNAGNSATFTSQTVNIDLTQPTLSYALDPTGPDGLNGWYKSDVDVTFTAFDALSGVDTSTVPVDYTVSVDGIYPMAGPYTVFDQAGNESDPVTISEIKLDKTEPVITVNVPVDESTYLLYESVTIDWSAFDALSGIASTTGPASGSQLDTSSVGTKSITFTATDNAGNVANLTVNYTVVYDFDGFFKPVDMDVYNIVKAGSAIPIKFSLNGDMGLNILYVAPTTVKINNPGADDAVLSGSVETVTAGKSSLSYDPDADQYIYVWKTEKAWAGTSRKLTITLDDGTYHTAKFFFQK